MNKFFQIIFLSFIISITGCCTKKYCECELVALELLLNFNQADANSFSNGSESDFYLISLDSNDNLIDSVPMYLTASSKKGDNYFFDIRLQKSVNLKYNNFIIVNRPLGFSDTIADLTYNITSYKQECNKCFLKKDYFDCEIVENVRFKNNSIPTTGNSFLINRN
jgi:hypothetical protein